MYNNFISCGVAPQTANNDCKSRLREVLENAPANLIIHDCFTKAASVFDKHENIICSISGGSDSDILIDICEKIAPGKAKYVFFDTGMEYEASKEHISYLEKRYGVEIIRTVPKTPAAVAVRKKGYPVFGKVASEMIHRLQLHNFEWTDEPYEVLIKKYPRCQSALGWWCNKNMSPNMNVSGKKYLKEFLIDNPPQIKISGACCMEAKKKPSAEVAKKYNADLMIYGVRKAEGGARAKGNCFSQATKTHPYDSYRMIFWFSKSDKEEYEKWYNIQHSRCYSDYGLCRTGCIGCPMGSDYQEELRQADIHEPLKARAARVIFKPSYDYTEMYKNYRKDRDATETKKAS